MKIEDVANAQAELESVVSKLYQRIEAFEEKISLLEVEQNDVELDGFPSVDSENKSIFNTTVYSGENKALFLAQRMRFLASEVAKINHLLEQNSLFKGKVLPLSKPVYSSHILVVCANYPHKDNLYGGAFIPARVKAYKDKGYKVSVCVASGRAGSKELKIEENDGVKIYMGDSSLLEKRIRELNPKCIVVHSPSLDNYNTFLKLGVQERLVFIFHGFEVRDVGHLWYNYDQGLLENRSKGLFMQDSHRKQVALDCFADERINKVFVSNFFKNLIHDDIGVSAKNVHVIPNLIEGELFPYVQKTKDDRLKVFSVRPYDNNNYGADMIVNTVLGLSEKSFFNELTFHIQGFGKTFLAKTAKIAHFDNVKVVEGILTREQISELHKKHGVALIPTRFDTQGVSVGEAMSSGLVPITNKCTAIPEFVNEDCAYLVQKDDVEGLVKSIESIYLNPDAYIQKSIRAASHIRTVCGPERTVDKEIEIVNKVMGNSLSLLSSDTEKKVKELTDTFIDKLNDKMEVWVPPKNGEKKRVFDKPRRHFVLRVLRRKGLRK